MILKQKKNFFFSANFFFFDLTFSAFLGVTGAFRWCNLPKMAKMAKSAKNAQNCQNRLSISATYGPTLA